MKRNVLAGKRESVVLLLACTLLLLTGAGVASAQPEMKVTVDKNVYAAGDTVVATMTLSDVTAPFQGPVAIHVEFVFHCGAPNDADCPVVATGDTSATISPTGTSSATADLVLPTTVTAGQYDLVTNLTFTQGGKYLFSPFGPIPVTNAPVPETPSTLLLLLPALLIATHLLRRKKNTKAILGV